MPAFFVAIGAWLTSKLGAFLGSIVFGLLQKLWEVAYAKISEWIHWKRREAEQAEKLEKVEEDVEAQKPRTDETRKNEEDWLNS